MPDATRIVILGGGFDGLEVARRLDRAFFRDASVEVSLVDPDNYFLFSPMLPEVAGSTIEPEHVVSPTRAFLRGVVFQEGEIDAVDLDARTVTVVHGATRHMHILPFDHLVFAGRHA